MPTPSTFRGELRNGAKPLNRRQILLLIGTDAGTSPQNPVVAGLGLTFEIRTGKQTTGITAHMVYMGDTNETRRLAVSFIQVSAGRWQAEGSAGGPNLGFLSQMDYSIAQPYELEITVVYSGGRDTQRYGLWVGSGHHSREEDCHTRENFNVRQFKCCYNGQGFRSATNLAHFDALGGEYDAIVSPGLEPAGSGFGWATGVPNTEVELICSDDFDLDKVYWPDWVTGLSTGKVRNPFINPTEDPPVAAPDAYNILPAVGRLDPVRDRTASDIPWENAAATARPAPPWWPDPPEALYSSWPDSNRILKPYLHKTAPLRPTSRSGRIRGTLAVQWITSSHVNSLGVPYEESIEVLDPTIGSSLPNPFVGPHLRFTLTGFDAGETVWLWVSALDNPSLGISGINYHPLDTFHHQLTRLTNGGGPGSNFNLKFALGGSFSFGSGGGPQFPYLPRGISGLNQWFLTRPGGIATIGTSGSLTFDLVADIPYMRALSGIQKLDPIPTVAGAPTLFFQGIVCRPGTGPRPTLSSDPWGVDWPHSSFLTTVSRLRLRRGLS